MGELTVWRIVLITSQLGPAASNAVSAMHAFSAGNWQSAAQHTGFVILWLSWAGYYTAQHVVKVAESKVCRMRFWRADRVSADHHVSLLTTT